MKKILTIICLTIIFTSCNSRKCKLDGCNNEGKGWLTTIEGGCTGAPCRPVGAEDGTGYCSKEHASKALWGE
jgi:hypothetical protein